MTSQDTQNDGDRPTCGTTASHTSSGSSDVGTIRVSPATPDDVPVVMGFIRGLAEYEKLTDQVVITEASLREHLFGSRRYAEVLIGRVEGRPAGYALFFHNYSTFLGKPGIYLEDLFVDPGLRGRGVGRALLAAVANLADERGCGRVEWSVLDWNAPAIGFYRKLGAEVLPDWRICRVSGDGIVAMARTNGAK